MSELPIIEHSNQRILTTRQIADYYGADSKRINDNFQRNKERYTIGKHYFVLDGKDLKQFKNDYPSPSGEVDRSPILYLWTEKGAALHAKLLKTDEAWEFYEKLVDEYFRFVKENSQSAAQNSPIPFNRSVQNRCITNEGLLPDGFWCVVNEMYKEALIIVAFQKELKDWALPDGSCGKKWRNHCKKNGIDLSMSRQWSLWVPNLKAPAGVWIYPYDLLETFRTWLRVEYADYYENHYSISRLANNQQIQSSQSNRQISGGGQYVQ